MALEDIPTRTSGVSDPLGIGVTKQNDPSKPLTELQYKLPAEEYNHFADFFIALCEDVGTDDSTVGTTLKGRTQHLTNSDASAHIIWAPEVPGTEFNPLLHPGTSLQIGDFPDVIFGSRGLLFTDIVTGGDPASFFSISPYGFFLSHISGPLTVGISGTVSPTEAEFSCGIDGAFLTIEAVLQEDEVTWVSESRLDTQEITFTQFSNDFRGNENIYDGTGFGSIPAIVGMDSDGGLIKLNPSFRGIHSLLTGGSNTVSAAVGYTKLNDTEWAQEDGFQQFNYFQQEENGVFTYYGNSGTVDRFLFRVNAMVASSVNNQLVLGLFKNESDWWLPGYVKTLAVSGASKDGAAVVFSGTITLEYGDTISLRMAAETASGTMTLRMASLEMIQINPYVAP